eukprot:COSAG01_NODE_707_length_14133_cov_34.324093_2_plen_160_part_00
MRQCAPEWAGIHVDIVDEVNHPHHFAVDLSARHLILILARWWAAGLPSRLVARCTVASIPEPDLTVVDSGALLNNTANIAHGLGVGDQQVEGIIGVEEVLNDGGCAVVVRGCGVAAVNAELSIVVVQRAPWRALVRRKRDAGAWEGAVGALFETLCRCA